MTTRTSPRSRSGSRRHCAAPRRAAMTPARLRGTRRRQATLGWTRCCAARLERTSPARHRKRLRRPASPQRRRENLTCRAVATTRPRASLQRHRENRTRRAVAMTRPRASPQRRRENRTRRPVAIGPIPKKRPAFNAIPTRVEQYSAERDSRNGTLWNIVRSLHLDIGSPNHLAPLLGFVGDELAKIGGREREHVATEVSKPRL